MFTSWACQHSDLRRADRGEVGILAATPYQPLVMIEF
jgi:hypothetical protein